jgi:uncharacterized membrane protein HdeD (DUF308 family)
VLAHLTIEELTKGAWPASKPIGLQRQQAVKVRTCIDDVRSSTMNGILAEQQWKGKLVAGALAAILGGVLLAWPGPSILVVSVLFGVSLLLTGFTEVYMAFTLPRSAPARVMWFIAGALSVVMAIFSFRHFGEGYAVLLLSLWVGVGFTFLGVSEIAVAGSLPALPGRFWYIVTGVISMIAGGVVVAWPFDSIVALDIVSGVWLVLIGLLQIVQAFRIRKDAKKVRRTLDPVAEPMAA